MSLQNRIQNQHLLWRAAFGPMAENAAELDHIQPKQLWQQLSKASSKVPVSLEVANNLVDGLSQGIKELMDLEKLTKEQKKAMRQQSVEDLKNLNLKWYAEMVNSEAQLREKMSLFWHGHFACRVINSFFQQELLKVIRFHALGNFGDLLRQVSKSPSMLQFLNNQQNRKQRPNENFAREVMELFTMGRGHYSETDIKEAARAFTGWGFNIQGEFVFRKNVHDEGQKTVLGKTGNFDGDNIIDMLLEQRQTARYITQKLYRFLVNEIPDDARIEWLANRFYQSGYEIKPLLDDIFLSDWMYEEKNIGNKIKSPIELMVGIQRLLPLVLDNEMSVILYQRALGQMLFYPPNVAGWPGGKTWIDSSTLMLRLRLPQIIAENELLGIQTKGDDDVMMGQMKEASNNQQPKTKSKRDPTATIQWDLVLPIFDKVPKEKLYEKVASVLLQTKSQLNAASVKKYFDNDSREAYIRSVIFQLMSTPEYQLC